MSTTRTLIVTLAESVPDEETANAHFEIIKTKLASYPQIKISGHISAPLPIEE